MLINLKKDISSNTIIVGDFSTALLLLDRSARLKLKDILTLKEEIATNEWKVSRRKEIMKPGAEINELNSPPPPKKIDQ